MPTPATVSTRPGWRGYALRLAAAGAIGVLGLELALRLLQGHNETLRRLAYNPNDAVSFDDADDLPSLLGNTLLGFQPRTEFAGFILNSRSLRTPEYSEAPTRNTQRTILLGDSFTFVSGGVPFEDHWPTRLQELLSASPDSPDTEVVNLSYPAVGPRFSKRMWELEGRRLNANRVIFAFFAGNDFTEEQGRHALGKELPGLKERLIDASTLLRSARNAWRIRQGVRVAGYNRDEPVSFDQAEQGGVPIPGYRERYDPARETFSPEAYLTLQRDLMELYAIENEALRTFVTEDVAITIEELARDVRSTSAEFLVVIFPAEFQVDPDFADAVAAFAGRTIQGYDLFGPILRLQEQLEERGISSFDLTPALRSAHTSGSVYQPRDTHWNLRGDRVVAKAIADRLRGE